jgi:CHAT domain-containing protein
MARDGERAVQEAVAPLVLLGLLQVDVVQDGSIKTLDRMLTTARREGHPYAIWHLAAHGRYDAQAERGTLAMTGADGKSHWVGAVELASLFSDDPQLQLVFLSSCHSAEGNAHDPWSAAASAFLLCGIPAVVAQQLEISHMAGSALASALYGALADGAPIEQAIAAGRRGIFNLPNYAEWMRPVLFMRSEKEASCASRA